MSTDDPSDPTTAVRPLPAAVPSRGGLGWIAWALPGATLVLTVLLLVSARPETIAMDAVAVSGYELEEGAVIRLSGVTVGEVSEVAMETDGRVRFGIELDPVAAALCTEGAALHVVRPRVSASGATGLGALIGPRSLVLVAGPPGGSRLDSLSVLDEEPPRAVRPEGLRVTLTSPQRQGIAAGAPVLFRGVRVGEVEEVRLSGDATAVLMTVWIEPGAEGLVLDTSRWWEVSGVELGLSLTGGVNVGLESLEAALTGGVAFATGPGGKAVGTGATFELQAEPRDSWLDWRTPLILGPGADLVGVPIPVLARQRWVEPGILDRRREREGWLVAHSGSLWGPRVLLEQVDGARDGRTELEVRGERLVLGGVEREAAVVSIADPSPGSAAALRARSARGGEASLLLLGERVIPIEPSAWVVRGEQCFLRAGLAPGPLLGALVVARDDGAVLGLMGQAGDGLHPLLPLP